MYNYFLVCIGVTCLIAIYYAIADRRHTPTKMSDVLRQARDLIAHDECDAIHQAILTTHCDRMMKIDLLHWIGKEYPHPIIAEYFQDVSPESKGNLKMLQLADIDEMIDHWMRVETGTGEK